MIQQLHRDLMAYAGASGGGKWKSADNVIEETVPSGDQRVRFVPTPAWKTPDAMESLCRKFEVSRDLGKLPDVILIAIFNLDFLCIHPFPDGNGRMARLLTLLLLYQGGYSVGRYVSLEKVIEETKEQYYDTLYQSSQGWHEGNQDVLPWVEYFLTVILRAYRRFEERIGDVEHTQKRGWKQRRVREVIQGFVADFRISDVEERCPGVSRATVTKMLSDLSKDGLIECVERGRNAKWVKVLPK
jgi:Fic family protein